MVRFVEWIDLGVIIVFVCVCSVKKMEMEMKYTYPKDPKLCM